MNLNPNEQLKDIYKSSIKASYFAGFKNNNSLQKSKLQRDTIDKEDKDIDDKTFRIAKSFTRPSDFIVSRHSGKCYLEGESLFACFSKVKSLLNSEKNLRHYSDQCKIGNKKW